jgi:hypothetical protein
VSKKEKPNDCTIIEMTFLGKNIQDKYSQPKCQGKTLTKKVFYDEIFLQVNFSDGL